MKVLLDTHALLWFAADRPELGRRSRQLASAAVPESRLCVSAISFWEIGMLAARGRLLPPLSAEEVRREALVAGLAELPLAGPAAVLAAALDLHRDPADRFIAATAIVHDALLVTADERLLGWAHPLKRQDARR